MDQQNEPTIRDLVALLRKGLVFALAVAIGASVLTYLLAKRATPTFDATATVLASQPDSGLQNFNVSLVTAPSLDATAYQAAAASTPVLTQALVASGQPRPSQSELDAFAKRVSIKSEENTKSSLINLSVRSTRRSRAAAEANALAAALVAWDKQRASHNLTVIVDTLKAQITSLDVQIAHAQASPKIPSSQLNALQQLRARQALQLNAAEALQASAVGQLEVLQPASVPLHPSAPRPGRSAALAFALGIILVYGLLLVRDALDTRFSDTEDLSRAMRLPVLAEFPRLPGGARRLPTEAANFLRTNVLFVASQDHPKILLVTSSGSAQGKSAVAASLAESFARSDYRSLLVDADLRRPTTARDYGLNMLEHTALWDYLQDRMVPYEPARVLVGCNQMHVVPSFKAVPSPTELLAQGFAPFLSNVREKYDVIVVDSAPVLPVADTLAIAPHVTGVLFTVSLPDTDRRSTQAALDLLERTGARLLGFVATNLEANRGRQGQRGYGYGYGYGSDSREPTAGQPPRTHTVQPDGDTKVSGKRRGDKSL